MVVKLNLVYNREEDTRIEGGDELVLSKDVLAVGISQRTDLCINRKIVGKHLQEERWLQESIGLRICEQP